MKKKGGGGVNLQYLKMYLEFNRPLPHPSKMYGNCKNKMSLYKSLHSQTNKRNTAMFDVQCYSA